jgi:hypothetical protein
MSSRVLFVLPAIPDEFDELTKNAIALRNTCATSGRCPACGTRGEWHPVEPGIWRLVFRHQDGCPVLRDWRDLGEEVA